MTRPTITSVFDALLADLGSDASRRGYRSDWKFFCAWLKGQKLTVLKVSPRDVKRYIGHLADKGQAHRTRGRALSVIRATYGALVAEELLKYNPAREVKDVRRGKSGKPVTWLEEEQLGKMLGFGALLLKPEDIIAWRVHQAECGACCSNGKEPHCDIGHPLAMKMKHLRHAPSWTDRRDRMCIQLLAGTGRRRSEIARMRFEDFTENGVTGVVKGGAEKTAPVPEWLRRELAEWAAFLGRSAGAVLPWSPEDDSPINGDKVYAIVKRVAIAVGIPKEKVAPHSLRRTLATLSERRNVPLGDIQAQLNHASRNTTEGYLKGSRKVERAPGEWMSELVKGKEPADGA